jgi:hypothetical protein
MTVHEDEMHYNEPRARNERRIIQISAHAGDSDDYSAVYALCDDGTLWKRASGHAEAYWKQIDNVPDKD